MEDIKVENKKVFIYANDTEMSKKIEATLRTKLVKSGTSCTTWIFQRLL